MPSLIHALAPIGIVLLSLPTPDPAVPSAVDERWIGALVPAESPLFDDRLSPDWADGLAVPDLADDNWGQVRIEQRMIIRIAPRMPGQMFAPPPGPPPQPRFHERKTDKCLPVANIAGVQIESQDRLLLVTRSRRLIGASLDKSCHARDFYSGFYVERSSDGQLCAGRDMIHSRAGANCAITKMRELVPEDD